MVNTMFTNYTIAQEKSSGSRELELISAAKQGDLEAFNQLVLSYQDRIYSMAFRLLGDEAQAEDITQDTFLAAFRSLPHFRNGSFRSWLFQIATNACYDELRRAKRRPAEPLEFEGDAEEKLFNAVDMHAYNPMPEKELERREIDRQIQQALNRLDADQKSVVVLLDIQELDYKEAAEILKIPIGTVKSRLARARRQLRNLIEL